MTNAMRGATRGTDIANEIRMSRGQQAGVAFLVVEGPSDKRFFERFIDKEKCKIIVAEGRENALDAFRRLETPRFEGALVIVDADFDVLEGRLPLPVGLLFTDTHDLETMIFASPAFEKFLAEVAQENKVETFREERGELRDSLLACGRPLGYLLWLSRIEKLSLRFEDLDFGKFIDDQKLTLDHADMRKAVANHSQRQDLAGSKLVPLLEALVDETHDAWHVCCGHHLTEILALALRKAWASNNANALNAERIEQMLRLAYEEVHFTATELYAAIQTWESLHRPFIVLRAVGNQCAA